MNDESHQLKYKVVRCQADRTYCKTAIFGRIQLLVGKSDTTLFEWSTSFTKEAYTSEFADFQDTLKETFVRSLVFKLDSFLSQ